MPEYQSSKVLSAWGNSIAGGVSGCMTRLLLQPLDVLKIRFQLQVARHHILRSNQNVPNNKLQPRKYQSMLHAVKLIIQEEGVAALWKGHVPAQFLSVAFGMVQFPVYELCSTVILDNFEVQHQSGIIKGATTFVSGGLAGVSATLVAQPLDVMRTRLVAQGHPKLYQGLLDAGRKMYQEQGIRTFYKGTWPTLLGIFPDTGCRFAFYKAFKSLWLHSIHKRRMSGSDKVEDVVCGGASGLVTKLLLLPFDTMKKRLQVVGFEKARIKFGPTGHYDGVWDCFLKILKNEGLSGFYKGAGPSIYKSALSTALIFHFYEQCLIALRSISQWQ